MVFLETFGAVHQAQARARRATEVTWKQWRALFAAAREFVATERAQRYTLHALVLGIGAISFIAVAP